MRPGQYPSEAIEADGQRNGFIGWARTKFWFGAGSVGLDATLHGSVVLS